MPISMSLKARYKLQSGVYDRVVLGPLSDRQIFKYELAGKYGPSAQLKAKATVLSEVLKVKPSRKKSERKTVNLFKKFDL